MLIDELISIALLSKGSFQYHDTYYLTFIEREKIFKQIQEHNKPEHG